MGLNKYYLRGIFNMISITYLFELDEDSPINKFWIKPIGKAAAKLFAPTEDKNQIVDRLVKNEAGPDLKYKKPVEAIKNVLRKHADTEDLKKLGKVVYRRNYFDDDVLGTYDKKPLFGRKPRIEIVPSTSEDAVKSITAHELSHHLDDSAGYKDDIPYPNRKNYSSRYQYLKDYYSHPKEFVARGGDAHVEYLENPHYVASGSPSLKEQIAHLRRAAKRLTPEQREKAHWW